MIQAKARPPFIEEGEVFMHFKRKEKPEALRELLVLTAEAFYQPVEEGEGPESDRWVRATAAVL